MPGNRGRSPGLSPLTARGHLVPGAAPARPPAIPAQELAMQDSWLPHGTPGVSMRRTFDATRVVQAGGSLSSDLLHPSLIPFEQLYRRLPEEGMYNTTVSPSRPFTFELGAFKVPNRMTLLLFDLRPDIYRFSGIDPGDYMPIEERRFGSIMGFDVTVDQKHPAQISYQLDPVPIQRTSTQAFQDANTLFPQANAGAFAIGRSNTFANSAGAGTALQPQRPTRYGALSIPFTLVAKSAQTVQLRCVVFRPIPSPIAFIEYDIAGILVPDSWYDSVTNATEPPVEQRK